MKYVAFIFAALLFAACNRSQGDIEFTGTAPGVTGGKVVISDQANTKIYEADIANGKFAISKRFLLYSGYYKLLWSANGGTTQKDEIYLQPGAYTIKLDTVKKNNYPLITSSSKIQNQLSAYYAIADSFKAVSRKTVVAINAQMQNVQNQVLHPGEYTSRINKMQDDELNANRVDNLAIFNTFMQKYPDNEIAAHLMLKADYQSDPVSFYKLFQKFSEAARNSDEGKQLDSTLKQLTKLAVGGVAPALSGTTPDGKKADIKALNKKIILLDFWRSGNTTDHENHQQISKYLAELSDKGFGIISVSLDTQRDKWLDALQADNMSWPQISDLKGDDSPNVASWSITTIPLYYLLDGQGHIIKRGIAIGDVEQAVNDYLQKHP
jgi:peroxiredoxin